MNKSIAHSWYSSLRNHLQDLIVNYDDFIEIENTNNEIITGIPIDFQNNCLHLQLENGNVNKIPINKIVRINS